MKNDSSILLNLPSGLKSAFDSCASDIDLSTSQLLRKIMLEYVKKHYNGQFDF